MILLVSNERDLTTDYIVLELQRRKIEYLRLNTERLPEASFRWRPASPGSAWEIVVSDRTIACNDLTAAYFRRPGAPVALQSIKDEGERIYCESEWSSLLRSLYTAIGDRWLNSPVRISMAEDKPLQLTVAAAVGLSVPATLVTNDHQAAVEFLATTAAVGKPLHTAVFGIPAAESDNVIYTNRVDRGCMPPSGAIEAAPMILQREIPKTCDLRVTVVGSRVFATAIDSQCVEETSVDWRRGAHPELSHTRHDLPADIATMCVRVVQQLGLRFAAIDLVLDLDGHYWFLEANPNGQWAWIENRTGQKIASAIVDELLAIAARSTQPVGTKAASA